jgi:surfactin synthase thioesterase subunit
VETPKGWFVRLEHRERAHTRLYVFPHAGAGPGALAALAAELPETVELWALNLPGRQARLHEPPRTDLEQLVADLVDDLTAADETDGPVRRAYFGYCGGALLAYLAARRVAPQRLFVGSFAAPDVALVPRRLHRLPGDTFWDVVVEQGGVPPELARPELRPVFEGALRADFALYADYHHRAAKPLPMPITVLYGQDDTELSRGSLLGWRRQSGAEVDLCELRTGHWLVDEDPAGAAACIADRIRSDAAGPVGAARGQRIEGRERNESHEH